MARRTVAERILRKPGTHSWSVLLACVCALASVQGADPDFDKHVKPFLSKYCVECHGADKEKGDTRVDGLTAKVDGKDNGLWVTILELVDAREMPPRKYKHQPSNEERKAFSDWLITSLDAAGHDAAFQRQLPEKGNHVPHALLFGPKAKRVAAATPARAWRLNPGSYKNMIVNSIGAHSNATMGIRMPAISPPISLSTERGIKDYAVRYQIRGAELEQMAEQVQAMITHMQAEYSKRRKKTEFSEGIGGGRYKRGTKPKVSRQDIEAAVRYFFTNVRRRAPDAQELKRYADFAQERIDKLGLVRGAQLAYIPIFVHPEALYRFELGRGPVDTHGRRRLSAHETADALSFALTNRVPDEELMARAADGSLLKKEEVVKQAKRLLEKVRPFQKVRDKLTLIRGSKTIGFFRQYFDYQFAPGIFKDEAEKKKYKVKSYKVGEYLSSLEMLIGEVLDRDKQVLKQLLTYGTPDNGFPTHWLRTRYQGKGEKRKVLSEARKPWDKKLNKRTGVLMQKAWLIAHTDNFDNHPIKRGRWIRERLLGGQIPDVPITVDAQLPEEPKSTLRHRMRVTRESECWLCHQRMDPLGLAFEGFDHFGQIRTKEQGKPVDTSGSIDYSGDPSIDGPVAGAEELIQKLASSELVHQVFVRHAFRYWLGRNEAESDAAVLQDAYKAYVESDGSMKALIVSLVSSDAFLYRVDPKGVH